MTVPESKPSPRLGCGNRRGWFEALRLKELLKKQEILDALTELRRTHPEAALPEEPFSEPSCITEIHQQLTGDVLTLYGRKGLTREQTLSLLGQLSVLIELVKRGQAQRNS